MIGLLSIILLWQLSWLLLTTFIEKSDERGQFGDMFGAVNSLFSGLALCGVAYTVYLQYESNKSSESQFKFNRLLDIINGQITIFNNRIEEFSFTKLESQKNVILNFSNGMTYYKSVKYSEKELHDFINSNTEIINSLIGFIFYSNKFIYDLIDFELIPEDDKKTLKSLYSRSINQDVINFLTMSGEYLKLQKKKPKSDFYPELEESLINIQWAFLRGILSNDYR